MRGYVVIKFFSLLHFLVMDLVEADVGSIEEPSTNLQKKAKSIPRTHQPRRRRRGNTNMPEDEQSRLLLSDLPERKQRQNASKDNLKFGRAGETWRDLLFPPTESPTTTPSKSPSSSPTIAPSRQPTDLPSDSPSLAPSTTPSERPSIVPTPTPSLLPTVAPSTSPTMSPSLRPTRTPTARPSSEPSSLPTVSPSKSPSASPSISSNPTGEMDGYFQPLDRPIRVACAGDSLTRGNIGFNSFDNSYPSQLQEILGERYKVYNYGVNSATATRGLSTSYGIRPEFQASRGVEPDIYLLMLGTNDAKNWDMNDFLTGMEWIVNQVRSNSTEPSVRIILALPPWAKTNPYGVRDEVLVNSVQPAIQNFAMLEDLQLVDMYDVTYNKNSSYIDDGLHLNRQGYRSLAAAWKLAMQCNDNGFCEVGENCNTCPGDCYLNCS